MYFYTAEVHIDQLWLESEFEKIPYKGKNVIKFLMKTFDSRGELNSGH